MRILHRLKIFILFLIILNGLTLKAHAILVNIDFSVLPDGAVFSKNAFASKGIIFDKNYFNAYMGGDDALNAGNMSAKFLRPVTSLSMTLVTGFQGTFGYDLNVYDKTNNLVANQSIINIQDEGNPNTNAFGYFQMSLDDFIADAYSFSLDSTFLGNTYGTPAGGPGNFGINLITFETISLISNPVPPTAPKSSKAPKSPTAPKSLAFYSTDSSEDQKIQTIVNPEPASMTLFGTGLAGIFFRRRKK